MQEIQPNIFPEINLFPRLERAGSWIAEHLSILPSRSQLHLSEHVRGAEAMLDQHLDDLEPAFNTSGR